MSEVRPQFNPENDAFRGDFEDIHKLQDEIRQIPENEANVEQNEFETRTKLGFERFKTITKEEFVKIYSSLSAIDRFRISAVVSTILIGNENKLNFDRKDPREVPSQDTLENVSVLEMGSFYGDAPDTEGYIEHAVANEMVYYGIGEYTGIDLDEPKDDLHEEPNFTGGVSKLEFLKIDARKIDERFPDRKWDMIFGNAFFGHPTRKLGRKGEIALLQNLSTHLRDGGIMWFKNNERMLLTEEDIKNIGFQYVDRDDLYRRLWAIRKAEKVKGVE